MKKTEEQLALELDQFLTAWQQNNRPYPAVDEAIAEETNLAVSLVDLAEATEPDPAFFAALEARITEKALRQKRPRPTTTPPWANLMNTLKDSLTMKRTIFALGGLAAIALIVFLVWSAGLGGFAPSDEPVAEGNVTATVEAPVVADVTETPAAAAPTETEEAETAVPTTEPVPVVTEPAPAGTVIAEGPIPAPGGVPPLPSLSGASGLSMGMGGAGGEGETGDFLPFPMKPLSDTEFIMNAELPTADFLVTVYSQQGSGLFDLEDAQRYAALFGFFGPAYVDPQPADSEFEFPPVYFFFDNGRTLSVSESGLYYYNGDIAPNYQFEYMPFSSAAPIAEAYLRDLGLMEVEFRPVSSLALGVGFRRIVDGREVILDEFRVDVNTAGEIVSVSYTPLIELTRLADYPVRSAAEAWQWFLDNGIDFQNASFVTYPAEDFVPPILPPPPPSGNEWVRASEAGARISIFPYPRVMLAANGEAPPRIEADQYLLLGSDEDLFAIADYAHQQIHVTGTLRDLNGRLALELESWEPTSEELYPYLPGLEGTIRREGDRVLFDSVGGETFLVPDAPADMETGTAVFVWGWRGEFAEDGLEILNWQFIQRVTPLTGEQMPEAPMPDGPLPFQIDQVTVESADLIYTFSPVFDEETALIVNYVLTPAWRFHGTTDRGEQIDIYVQAVPAEYLQPTE